MKELSCKQTEKLIPYFIKDEMDNYTKRQFLAHVEECPSCYEELSIQFLVSAGMQRLENGDTFDLNRELKMKMFTERRHLHILTSLQGGLYATEAIALLLSALILTIIVL
ncbi:MAG: zf-HC2 domain-containing protein [Lachnospiraceae bacterium]|nr:zf-HC2 domain-containing protein [Lachnospiraceae bacterium]